MINSKSNNTITIFSKKITLFCCSQLKIAFSIQMMKKTTIKTTWRIFSKKNKRWFKIHFESFTFIDEIDFIWRVWIIKMHDKMIINNDYYDIDMFAIITIIDWTNDEIDKHIQSIRDFDIDHFKNWHIMINFLSNIIDDFDFKRNMRN